MSGLSSLSGAPAPFGLSSLSSAPPLSAKGVGVSSSLGTSSRDVTRNEPMRMSSPVFSSQRGKQDDDDDPFPKAKGLGRKKVESSKPSTGLDSDSDDDFRPPSMTRSGAAAGTSKAGTAQNSAPRSTSPLASSSTNPILAMLDKDDDDDLLAGLAPPKKAPTPDASTNVSSSGAGGLGSSSAKEKPAPDVSLSSTVPGPRRGAGPAVGKSVDTLMSLLKDDDIFSKPLPSVQEDTGYLFGDSAKSGNAPRKGRRAGGDDSAGAPDAFNLSDTSAAPKDRLASTMPASIGRSTPMTPEPHTGFADVGGSGRLSGTGRTTPPAAAGSGAGGSWGSGQQQERTSGGKAHMGGVGSKSMPASASGRQRPPPEDDSDLSDDDLPGMGPASGRAAAVAPAPLRASMPNPTTTSTSSTTRKSGNNVSWELDDALLPDTSAAGGNPATGISAGRAAGAATASGRQPSRLQHSTSARDRTPDMSTSHEDIEDSSAYTPSFGSTLRGGPNPFNSMTPAEQPTDARQRRVLPDSSVRSSMTSGVGAGGSSNAPKSKEEQERERTAAAMAAALARRQQLQQSTPAVAPAPAVQSATGGSNVGFRLPSERRAIDSLSVQVNSPAGSTPKPAPGQQQAQMAAAGTGSAGRPQPLSQGSAPKKGLAALDASSSDDDLLPPPLRASKSPQASVTGAPTSRSTSPSPHLTASAPDAGVLKRQGQGQATGGPHFAQQSQLPALPTQSSTPVGLQMSQQAQHQEQHGSPVGSPKGSGAQQQQQSMPQQGLSQSGSRTLPPGVEPGTIHMQPAVQQQVARQQVPQQVVVPVSGLPPNIVPLATVPQGVVPIHPTQAVAIQQQQPQRQQPQQQPGAVVTEIAPLGQAQTTAVQTGNTPSTIHVNLDSSSGVSASVTATAAAAVASAAAEVSSAQAAQLRDVTNRVAALSVELEKEKMTAKHLREENARLKIQVSDMDMALRSKDQQIRDAENRVVSQEARSKLLVAETQAVSLKESTIVRSELEDLKACLARVKSQYAELEQDKNREVARLKAELESTRLTQSEEVATLKREIADLVVAAEARGRRAGLIEKEVAEAQLKAQQAALDEEKEVVHRQRLSAELLAQLTEKVRTTAAVSWEREERAVRALEREVQDRDARLSAREKAMTDREAKVAAREKEVDALRSDLTALSQSLEHSVVHEKEDIRREQARLARESARMEALQGSLISDKEDLKVQVSLERKMLEDAREARRKEREALLTEVAADRRALATEHADLLRQMDASRAELLQLKAKVVEYEARASSALAQALQEEERLTRTRQHVQEELDSIGAARAAAQADRAAVESEAVSLVEFAKKLQDQSEQLAASHTELEAGRSELSTARQDLAKDIGQVRARELELQVLAQQLDTHKQSLDRERLAMASERKSLNDERLSASKAAGEARDAQMRLAEAVRQWVAQGVPIPFTVESVQGGAALKVKTGVSSGAAGGHDLPGPVPSVSPMKAGASPTAGHRRNRGGLGPDTIPAGRSRNSLRYMLGRLGLDMDEELGRKTKVGGLAGSQADYIRSQKQFLNQLRMSAPSAGVLDPLQLLHSQATYPQQHGYAPAPGQHASSMFTTSYQGPDASPSVARSIGAGLGKDQNFRIFNSSGAVTSVTPTLFASGQVGGGGGRGRDTWMDMSAAHQHNMKEPAQMDQSEGAPLSTDFPSMAPVSASSSERGPGASSGGGTTSGTSNSDEFLRRRQVSAGQQRAPGSKATGQDPASRNQRVGSSKQAEGEVPQYQSMLRQGSTYPIPEGSSSSMASSTPSKTRQTKNVTISAAGIPTFPSHVRQSGDGHDGDDDDGHASLQNQQQGNRYDDERVQGTSRVVGRLDGDGGDDDDTSPEGTDSSSTEHSAVGRSRHAPELRDTAASPLRAPGRRSGDSSEHC